MKTAREYVNDIVVLMAHKTVSDDELRVLISAIPKDQLLDCALELAKDLGAIIDTWQDFLERKSDPI